MSLFRMWKSCKLSHIQNLELNKVRSAKQVSNTGNHDTLQWALREKNTCLHCSLQSLLILKGLEQHFISTNVKCVYGNSAALPASDNGSEGLSIMVRTRWSDRYCEMPHYSVELYLELIWNDLNYRVHLNAKFKKEVQRRKTETKMWRQAKLHVWHLWLQKTAFLREDSGSMRPKLHHKFSWKSKFNWSQAHNSLWM